MAKDLVVISEDEIAAEDTVQGLRGRFDEGRAALWFLIQNKTWEKRQLDRDIYFKSFGFQNGYKGACKFVGDSLKLLGQISFDSGGDVLVTHKPPVAPAGPTDPDEQSLLDDILPDTPAEAEAKIKAKKAEERKEEKKVEAAQAKGIIDSAGHLVPSFLIDVFTNAEKWKKHRDEIRDLGRLIASLAKRTGGECCAAIETLVEVKRDEHGQIVQSVCHAMNNVANDIEAGYPYSVCPSCKGANAIDNSNLCFTCQDRGWLTMEQWALCDNKQELEVAGI